MSLMNIASNAISNANVGASTASKNIQNVNTDGYAREKATFSTGPGNYVYVNVERMVDNFTSARFRTASAASEFEKAFADQMSQINSAITSIAYSGDGDYSNAFSKAANDVYQAVIKLSSDDTLPNREVLLSSLETFKQVATNIDSVIDEQKSGISDSIRQNIESINSSLASIESTNKAIRGSGGEVDNSVLSKRDQELNSLSEMMGVKVTYRDDGSVDVTTQEGVDLLDQEGARNISYRFDQELDRFSLMIGNHETTAERFGGSVGGFVKAYDALNMTKSEIGGLYHTFGSEINNANQQGFTSAGVAGGDLVTLPSLGARGSSFNSQMGSLNVDTLDHFAKQPIRFEVTRTGGGYEIHNLVDGTKTTEPSLPFTYRGVDLSETGTIQIGDTFVVDPMSGSPSGSSVTTNYDDIALSGTAGGGSTNAENTLNFTKVFDQRSYNGSGEDLHTFIATTLSRIGEVSKSADHRLSIAESNFDSAKYMRDQVQGVDLNEENISLVKYQTAYQAASKIIQTQTRLMNALLGAM